MHIVFLSGEYPPHPHGGIGVFTQTLARALVSAGHFATVLGLYPIPQQVIDDDYGVQVIRLPQSRLKRGGFAVNYERIRRALLSIDNRQRIDLLEGQENSLAFLSRNAPYPRVIRMHGGHHFFSVTLGAKPRLWRSFIERRSFSRAFGLCAVSQFVAEKNRELLRLGDQEIAVIPNPVDVRRFSPTTTDTISGLIVFVGTITRKKGIVELIKAMPQIIESIPYATLWIVGGDTIDPVTRKSMTSILEELVPDIRDHIIFKGRTENEAIPDLLAQAEVAVYPSLIESMGIAWIEGMAAGRAIVASQTGPGPEIIQHGINGLLCDPHNSSSIAESVIRLLQDGDLRSNLGQAARKTAIDRYSVDTLVESNIVFYQKTISEFEFRFTPRS